MKRQYQEPELEFYLNFDKDVIVMSGDGFVDDPWSEGLGG